MIRLCAMPQVMQPKSILMLHSGSYLPLQTPIPMRIQGALLFFTVTPYPD